MSEAIRILIVDDEELARNKIRRFLREIQSDRVEEFALKDALNGFDAVEAVKVFKPQLLFLDIQMPGMNGFDVLAHLSDRDFQVIFQTANDGEAIRAFEENACDYLLKPFTRERFRKALERALGRLRDVQEPPISQQAADKFPYLQRILVQDRGIKSIIEVEQVECFVARDHYCSLVVDQKEYLSELSLARLAESLDPEKFLRVHRNSIVQLAAVKSICSGSNMELELKSGQIVSVSRRSRTQLATFLRKLNL